MIIQKTEPYDDNIKQFKVIEYCCAQMGREMKDFEGWEINEESSEMYCWDGECAIGGKFCSHCGQKIIIQDI